MQFQFKRFKALQIFIKTITSDHKNILMLVMLSTFQFVYLCTKKSASKINSTELGKIQR